jgi:hypothetical protein
MLVLLPSPISKLRHALLPQSATSQRTCLDSLLFCCFHFRLTFESIKGLGSASLCYKRLAALVSSKITMQCEGKFGITRFCYKTQQNLGMSQVNFFGFIYLFLFPLLFVFLFGFFKYSFYFLGMYLFILCSFLFFKFI